MIQKPTGTVTFLFTDIEGSTHLWEQHSLAMPGAHKRQEAIIRQSMTAYGGYVYKMIGDAFQVAFSTAPDALMAAIDAQHALQSEGWGEIGDLKVRMALHACVTEERDDDYLGPDLNRIARIMSVGHGGQVLLSHTAYELVQHHLPEEVMLYDLGEHFLKDLIRPEHIYQLIAPGLSSSFPPLKIIGQPSSIPTPNTPFVGREAELTQIETLLLNPECHLISLVGIGGSGKTRLALQSARQIRVYQGSANFIGLAAITSLDDFLSAIAETVKYSFRIPPGSNLSLHEAQNQLLTYLSDKKLLLVLDNFEQMISCAPFLTEMLEIAPKIKLLVTSRERLNLPGEWVLEVDGLTYPGEKDLEAIPQYAAVQMFIRVAERGGQLTITESDWPSIARICRLLEGIPLGIEMAAAWTKVLSCSEIAAEIEHDLDFLTSTWRGMPERHQTLRIVFNGSWCLLAEAEKVTLRKLAIFQAGFTREAALKVADAPLTLLASLVDKSFVHRVTSGRFDIHPILKQYTIEKLEEKPDLLTEMRSQHAIYYSEWLCRLYVKLKGSEQHSTLAMLKNESQNLRLGRQTLLELQELERLEQALPAILLLDVMNDQQFETREMTCWLFALNTWLQNIETTSAGITYYQLYALTLAALRRQTLDNQHPEHNIHYQEKSLHLAEILPDSESKAFVYLLNCISQGLSVTQAITLCQQSAEIFRRVNDSWGIALSLLILADTANFSKTDIDLARQSYQSSMEIFASLKNDWGQALCYTGLTYLEYNTGHLEEAYRLGKLSLETLAHLKNFERLLEIRHLLGEISTALGLPDEARRHFRCNLAYSIEIGNSARIAYYTERLARTTMNAKSG